MRIILSPAKQMVEDSDTLLPAGKPVFLSEAGEILNFLRSLSPMQLKALWGCNDKIAVQNIKRLERMDFSRSLTPAILAYDGIAFKYMAPGVFENGEFSYVQAHLRILSGFYGVLKPLDGVEPYRLEMQAKAAVGGNRDLYAFWGDKLYREVRDDSGIILNLASKEYSRCMEAHLTPADTYITCVFGELSGGRVVQKGVYAKMSRGEMVRYMAENAIENPEAIKNYNRLGYSFDESRSDSRQFVFLK